MDYSTDMALLVPVTIAAIQSGKVLQVIRDPNTGRFTDYKITDSADPLPKYEVLGTLDTLTGQLKAFNRNNVKDGTLVINNQTGDPIHWQTADAAAHAAV
jgi:hypothetical protein